jgi:hypothetical protein
LLLLGSCEKWNVNAIPLFLKLFLSCD